MDRRPLLVSLPCLVAIGVALLAPGCLSDLRPPTQCPAPAKHAVAECPPPPTLGQHLDMNSPCISPDVSSCLTGPRPMGCACQGAASECPDDPAACYPPGDCPPEVVAAAAGRKVTCIRLAEADLVGGLPQDCSCGCVACASVCDGVGPVVALLDPPNNAMPLNALVVTDLASYLPSSGQIGVYVRARGAFSAVGVGVAVPGGGTYATGVSVGSQPSDFSVTTLFDPMQAPKWSDATGAPQTLVVSAPPDQPQALPSLVEIDCVVPFVVQ